MAERDYLLNSYKPLAHLAAMHVADFSDADMLVRPGEQGNHAAWHLGHLTTSLVHLIGTVTPGVMPKLDPSFMERHGKKGSEWNDGFESKEKLLARFKEANDAAMLWAKGLTEQQMAQKTIDALQGFAPAVGDLAYVLPPHAHMHLGQIQAIRRKLGKPVLF